MSNLARSQWRDGQRERDTWLSLGVEGSAPPPDADLLDAVERLPERLRSVVLLHYFADLPVAEVATALRRPTGTVKRRLHEARTLLRDSLREDTP